MDLPLQWSGALRGVLIGHQLAHRHRVRDTVTSVASASTESSAATTIEREQLIELIPRAPPSGTSPLR